MDAVQCMHVRNTSSIDPIGKRRKEYTWHLSLSIYIYIVVNYKISYSVAISIYDNFI
jgi:hypothetical protein